MRYLLIVTILVFTISCNSTQTKDTTTIEETEQSSIVTRNDTDGIIEFLSSIVNWFVF